MLWVEVCCVLSFIKHNWQNYFQAGFPTPCPFEITFLFHFSLRLLLIPPKCFLLEKRLVTQVLWRRNVLNACGGSETTRPFNV